MKHLTALLLFASALWGQSLVTITGPIKNADGTPYNGVATITNTAMRCAGVSIPANARTITITNGEPATALQLYPTVGCNVPTGYYTIRYRANSTGATSYGYIQIPSTPTTTTMDAVQSMVAPTPNTSVSSITGTTGTNGGGAYLAGGWAWRALQDDVRAMFSAGTGISLSNGVITNTALGDWTTLLNKPSAFTPATHALSHGALGSDPLTLGISQITSLQGLLDGKEPILSTQYGVRIGNGTGNDIRLLPECSNGTTDKLLFSRATGFVCGADQVGASGGGIASLGGQTGSAQTFGDDTNVTMTSSGNVHTLGWAGTLAMSRGGFGQSMSAFSGIPKFSAGTLSTAAKADLGLGNVDNTADTAKPVSALQQAELDTKPTRTYGTAPPTSTPGAVGDIYTDTVARSAYTAFCTTSSACWGLPAATADISQGIGIVLSNSPTVEVAVDDTTMVSWVAVECGATGPGGVGGLGVMAFCTDSDDRYSGTGAGWAKLNGSSGVSAGTAGQVYGTNESGSLAMLNFTFGGGLLAPFSGSTRSVTIDTTAIPTLASDNVWTGKEIHTPTAVQTLAAGTPIVAARVVEVAAASDITLTATPTIAAGSAGEFMTLANTSSSYKITLQDETHLTGAKLFLAASANYELKPRNTIQLMYSDTVGGWMQIGGGAAAACSARPIGSMYGNTIGSYYGVGIGTLYCI